jgi:N-acetyl-gamma-glutamyl-phosphate reductase
MSNKEKIKVAIIGASGYTGAELIRILLGHPNAEITSLIAGSNAGQNISDIYQHLSHFSLPKLKKIEETDFSKIDVAFCCLPHTTAGEVIKSLMENKKYSHLKIIDLSADFRLEDGDDYKNWYEHDHSSLELQKHAVYGLTEFARNKIKKSRLVACPGCYPTSALLPLLPLIDAGLIETNNIIIDSKSGVTGAGRSLKTANLFCEINDGMKAYGVAIHRHNGEIEQELSKTAGKKIKTTFTPHLAPMSRGIISTIYVTIKNGRNFEDIKNCLETRYEDEYFVNISNDYPSTKDVFGTNFCKIAIFKSRQENQAVIVSVIDNLTKGASGQAVQNMNIMFGFDEKSGLTMAPIFP